MKAIKVTPHSIIKVIQDTSLKGLEEAIDCTMFQAVYLNHNPFEYKGHKYNIMLVNDDGLALGLIFNTIGTSIYKMNTIPNNHIIVGDIIFTTSEVWN